MLLVVYEYDVEFVKLLLNEFVYKLIVIYI